MSEGGANLEAFTTAPCARSSSHESKGIGLFVVFKLSQTGCQCHIGGILGSMACGEVPLRDGARSSSREDF